MNLEIRRLVGDERVGRGVRFVEAVARELFHLIEEFAGGPLRDAVFCRPRHEYRSMPGHLLGFLLAHRPAQQVCSTQRIAADRLRDLHHLLLVDHDPVG